MTDKIKPCPFCGNGVVLEMGPAPNVAISLYGKSDMYWIAHIDKIVSCIASCELTAYFSRDDAIAAWNNRPTENELTAKIEKLRGLLGRTVQEASDHVMTRYAGQIRKDDEDAVCLDCGKAMQLVRPGRWQCDNCEAQEGGDVMNDEKPGQRCRWCGEPLRLGRCGVCDQGHAIPQKATEGR